MRSTRPKVEAQVAHVYPNVYFANVSAAEIIAELPKLTEAERRAVRGRLIELAVGNAEVESCDVAAVQGAQLLDRLEEEDARRPSR